MKVGQYSGLGYGVSVEKVIFEDIINVITSLFSHSAVKHIPR